MIIRKKGNYISKISLPKEATKEAESVKDKNLEEVEETNLPSEEQVEELITRLIEEEAFLNDIEESFTSLLVDEE